MQLHTLGFIIFSVVLLPSVNGISCTTVTASQNGMVIAGHNEDGFFNDKKWNGSNHRIFFVPAIDHLFGCFYFSYGNSWPQGGMNDQSLFLGDNGVAPTNWSADPAKPTFPGNSRLYIIQTCASVMDVRLFFETYNIPLLNTLCFPITDRSGASMVVEYANKTVQFVPGKTWYQITTNFVHTKFTKDEAPCWRFNRAQGLLADGNKLNTKLIHSLLSDTHQERDNQTVYSAIYNLKAGLIEIYYMGNFEKAVIFNLAEELKKGAHNLELSSIFSIE